jgi:hypothetical protein
MSDRLSTSLPVGEDELVSPVSKRKRKSYTNAQKVQAIILFDEYNNYNDVQEATGIDHSILRK